MTLLQFMSQELGKTSENAISVTVIYAILAAIRAAVPRIIAYVRTSRTDIKLTQANGSGVEMSIDPTLGSADIHITPRPREPQK